MQFRNFTPPTYVQQSGVHKTATGTRKLQETHQTRQSIFWWFGENYDRDQQRESKRDRYSPSLFPYILNPSFISSMLLYPFLIHTCKKSQQVSTIQISQYQPRPSVPYLSVDSFGHFICIDMNIGRLLDIFYFATYRQNQAFSICLMIKKKKKNCL